MVKLGPDFDGETYERAEDHKRLTGQLLRVFTAMKDQRWHTLDHLVEQSGGSTASVSARLRDLRKEKFGAFVVERRRKSGGLYEYRLLIPVKPPNAITEQETLL
jgi:hypothetical protein